MTSESKTSLQNQLQLLQIAVYYRSSIDKDGAVEDSRTITSKTLVSPAGPTAADLRSSKLLEETLKSFNMFESDAGMHAR